MKWIILNFIFIGTSIALTLDELEQIKSSLDEDSFNDLMKALIKEDIEKTLQKIKSEVSDIDIEEYDEARRSLINSFETEEQKRGMSYITKTKVGAKKIVVKLGCEDKIKHCHTLTQLCDTKGYERLMRKSCEKTCEFCQECKDKLPRRCKKIPKAYCKVKLVKEKMIKYCAETCGCGRTHSPPPCISSKHGCCWDKVTTRKSSDGDDGCPECCERRPRVCRLFKNYCKRQETTAGKWLKYSCPMTCGFCVAKDLDEKLCKWAASKNCKIDYRHNVSVKEKCQKTCPGFCKKPSTLVARYRGGY